MCLVFVILMLLPALAHAEPVTAILGAYVVGTVTVGQILLFAGSMLYGMAQQRKQKKLLEQQKRDYNAGLRDRTANQIATEAPHVYVYGRARVGGSVVAMFASGDRDQYKHIVTVHAAHECDAIEDVFINGVSVGPLDANGYVVGGKFSRTRTRDGKITTTGASVVLPEEPIAGSVAVTIGTGRVSSTVVGKVVTFSNPVGDTCIVSYQFKQIVPMLRVDKHLGTPDDPVDPFLHASLPGKWPETAVLRGYTYTVLWLNLNLEEFQNGFPQIEVLLRGKKLYDFRTGATRWSQNNAEVIYDYLTSELCDIDPVDLPLDQYIAAANVCDEVQDFGPRYKFDGTIDSDMQQSQVLERMAQSMAGGIVATTWGIYAGKYTAPVMVLEQSDIVGSLAISPGISDADLYNGVRGQYTGAETNYVATDFPPYQNVAYRAADERDLYTNIDFSFTDGVQRIHNLCRIFTEDQRNGYMYKAEYSLKAWSLQVGQRILKNCPFAGWNAKVFRVMDKKFTPGGMVEVSLKSDASGIWDFADAVSPTEMPATDLPNPFEIEPVSSVLCQSGNDQLIAQDGTVISRLLVTWPLAVTPSVFMSGLIEIEWQLLSSDVWAKTTVNGNETRVYLTPVEDNEFYQVRVRTVNPALNLSSDWTYAALHQVLGKSDPPGDVIVFSIANDALSWSEVVALDMAGYVLRFQYAQNASWGDAAPMHNGLILASPWEPTVLPPGPITIMIKAVDTSGNESVNAAVIFHNFGDTIVDNLILVVDEKALGFPGQKLGGSVIAGDLQADDSGDLFWGADSARFWGADSALFWPPQTFKEMVYIASHMVQADEAGSRLTLALGIVAASYTVEFRYDTQGLFWGADEDYFWGADDELFWPPPGAWAMWPGAIDNVPIGLIEFRVVTQAGAVRGVINEFAIQFDVEDEYEEIDDVHITAAGTRLPITKAYRSIKNVQLTLQDDADAAVTVKIADKLATGPLIYCFDIAGSPVTGTIDARIQGVKG